MRLAISNIAWDTSEDILVAKLLNKFGIDAIDIAPSKYFPDLAKIRDADVEKVRLWWADYGIEIIGMQGLLFGTTGLNLFGTRECQEAMLNHLQKVFLIGGGLGATKMVFGSPKNRDRGLLSDEQTLEQAINFFTRLGNYAQECGVTVCLEPNPKRYGANFMNTSAETAMIVKAVSHKAIRMHFDMGALTINGESPDSILHTNAHFIEYIHASEPDLVPLGDGGTDHQRISSVLKQYLPETDISIEMLATKDESHQQSIERALSYAAQFYKAVM